MYIYICRYIYVYIWMYIHSRRVARTRRQPQYTASKTPTLSWGTPAAITHPTFLSSEYGTCKTVKARLWLQWTSPQDVISCSHFTRTNGAWRPALIYICIHIYIYTYIYMCVYVYVCIYIYVYMWIYIHLRRVARTRGQPHYDDSETPMHSIHTPYTHSAPKRERLKKA